MLSSAIGFRFSLRGFTERSEEGMVSEPKELLGNRLFLMLAPAARPPMPAEYSWDCPLVEPEPGSSVGRAGEDSNGRRLGVLGFPLLDALCYC